MASHINLSTVLLWRASRVIYGYQWHLSTAKSRDSMNTMRASYTYIRCDSYRVKNKNILARLLNFFKLLIGKIISGSNGFTEFKIQWVPSISWYLFSYVEIYVIELLLLILSQVVKDAGDYHDKRRLFYSSIMNDNLIDSIIEKVNVRYIKPKVWQNSV